ncbi:HK97-gp10 family putative phage morphogenesis protein [Natronococcus roseus]|uniref:HK97-gp10 family putative phage morphogenesis protein n=1 Tax=Natronococcus roseus TaxID=1052014 RepID=UPI00374CA4D1
MAGASLRGIGSLVSTTTMLREKWTSQGSVVYTVGSSAEYSVYVEFGTSTQGAQPYLRPAVQRVQSRLASIASEAAGIEEFVKVAAHEIERIAKEEVPVDTGNLRASIRVNRVQ